MWQRHQDWLGISCTRLCMELSGTHETGCNGCDVVGRGSGLDLCLRGWRRFGNVRNASDPVAIEVSPVPPRRDGADPFQAMTRIRRSVRTVGRVQSLPQVATGSLWPTVRSWFMTHGATGPASARSEAGQVPRSTLRALASSLRSLPGCADCFGCSSWSHLLWGRGGQSSCGVPHRFSSRVCECHRACPREGR